MKGKHAIAIITIILIIDQVVKVWIKTNMYMGEEIHIIGDWFRLHFTENPGMAFGMTFGGSVGKIALTSFRIVAVFILSYLLKYFIDRKASTITILSFSLIIAGAIGNIIDSIFYGIIFEESSRSLRNLAQIFPPGGGYGSFLQGRVVDMLYFPLYEGYLPQWVPYWGGKYSIFFRPVFNIADSAITVGVILFLLFNRSFFTEEENLKNKENTDKLQIGN